MIYEENTSEPISFACFIFFLKNKDKKNHIMINFWVALGNLQINQKKKIEISEQAVPKKNLKIID